MTLGDIVKRVQSLLDDPGGTYVDEDYVIGFAQHESEKLYNKLRNSGQEFDEVVLIIPNVNAGLPDLGQYFATGQPLAGLVNPRIIEWRLPGQDDTFFRQADGPLDRVRDIPPGYNRLDSWAWIRRNIFLSSFSVALDLRITGDFLFDPLTADDSQIQIAINANVVLTCMIAVAIAKARGNPTWVQQYTMDADEAFDELFIGMVKADQGKTRRVARISRRSSSSTPIIIH